LPVNWHQLKQELFIQNGLRNNNMGMTKEDEAKLKDIINSSENGTKVENDFHVDEYPISDSLKQPVKLPYNIEVTRIHNKVFAPKGLVYLVVRYKHPEFGTKYISSLLMKSELINDETKLIAGEQIFKYII